MNIKENNQQKFQIHLLDICSVFNQYLYIEKF